MRTLVFVLAGLPIAVFAVDAAAGVLDGAVSEAFDASLVTLSIALSCCAAAISVAVGLPAGLAAARLSRRARGLVFFAFLLPLAMPPSIHAYLWRNLALEAGLLGLLFVEGGSKAVNFAGATLSLVSAYWTLPALAVFAVARGAGRRYEAEARVFAPGKITLREILLPCLVAPAAGAGLLVFILALSDYGAASTWQVRTFSENILSLYSSLGDTRAAAVAGLVPAAVVLAAAAALVVLMRKRRRYLDVEGSQTSDDVLWRPSWAAKLLLALALAVLVSAPTAAAAAYAVSFAPQAAILAPVFADLARSVLFSLAAAAVAGIVALAAAVFEWHGGGRGWASGVLAVGAFLAPAAAMGLAVIEISRWAIVPRWFSSGSAVVVYAMTGRFLALPLVAGAVFFLAMDRRYGDMAAVCGRRSLRSAVGVAPLALPAVAAGAAVAAVLATGELSLSSLVAPPGNQPVSVNLFNLMHYAHQGEAFVAGLSMMFAGAGAAGAALWIAGRLWKRYLPQA